MALDESLPQLVVVGASAGGIEALTVLLGTLPADFPAPIVIAQHLDPARPSHLEQVLSRHSTLPVRTVQDEARMDQGVVYVVPSDRDVLIEDGHVRVTERQVTEDGSEAASPAAYGTNGPSGVKPSIDRLLRTAATSYGEGLIAVILSGLGADGAAGARDVKHAGGMVVVQNPATARFPAMPQSLAPTTVDIVAELESIGPLLHELLTGPRRVSMPEEDRRLRTLLAQVREQTGIDFGAYKTPTILRRLQRRMVATDTHRLADYLRYLQRHPEEYHRLATSFLIKVTGFFRDPELYAYLREHVVPELIDDARKRGNELRLWSAGCATGEEAYSLALLVADTLGDELERFSVRVFATDLDEGAIGFARRGVYPAQALQDVPPHLVERYFIENDGEYTVRKSVRALTVFGQHDLGQRAPFPRIDLALCRNVLIYFTPELQRRALQLFAFALRQGGYLALGKAETTTPLAEFFSLADARLKVYRRQGGHAVTIPAARIRDAAPTAPARAVPGATPLDVNPGTGGAAVLEAGEILRRLSPRPPGSAARLASMARGAAERPVSVLQHLPVGVVVVNRRYDVQTINAAARRVLGIHSAAVGEDFLHQLRQVPVAELRGLLDAALRGAPSGHAAALTVELPSSDGQTLHLECAPYRMGGDAEALAIVTITDVTALAHARRQLEAQIAELRSQATEAEQRFQDELARMNEQAQRLAESNRDLLAANQELVEANAELHNQNEELLVGHEEAEAATEEVETLNEELQATNEEQETLNEELQATVEELNTTNDDLEARSHELQTLAGSLEAERTRLQLVLSSMSDGVLVLSESGAPMLVNDAYRRMFCDGAHGPIVFPSAADRQGRALPANETIQARAARGQPFTMRFAVTGPGAALAWFEAKGQPASGAGDRGTVITIRELDGEP